MRKKLKERKPKKQVKQREKISFIDKLEDEFKRKNSNE